MRRSVPDTQAVLRGSMNSKPSLETSVTYSEGVVEVVVDILARDKKRPIRK